VTATSSVLAHSSDEAWRIEPLLDAPRPLDRRLRGGVLPPPLARSYGADLTIALRRDQPTIVANFVSTLGRFKAGIMTMAGATAGPGGFRHEFVTTPGVLAVVDGIIAGVLAAVLGSRADLGASSSMGIGVVVFATTIDLLSVFQDRRAVRPRGLDHVRFPQGPQILDLGQGFWSRRLQ